MIKSDTFKEFKMGLGREQREDDLEKRHRDILDQIERTEMPGFVNEMWGHPYGDYSHVHQMVKEHHGVSFTSVILIALAGVLMIGGLAVLIAYWPW